MSEFIDNVEQSPRASALLEFVRRVHDGATASEIATAYEDAIDSVRPSDVLVLEHELLEDGISVSAVKAESEPLLATFRQPLETNDWERPERGHPIDNMLRENRAIESHLDALEAAVEALSVASSPPLEAVSDLQDHIVALEGIDRHFVRKENELFPHLEEHWKHDRPLGVMWSIHDDLRSLRRTIEDLSEDPETNPETLSRLVARFTETARGLLFKEEAIVFPVALRTLTDREWEQIQRESMDLGYFEIDPAFALLDEGATDTAGESVRRSSAGTETQASLSSGSVALGLDTGTLELDQLQLLLETIPVDVTYVDENDRVRYFNNPEERIFPRSGSIIGRTVQNCHPPESVDTVEEILEAFRSGEHDSARFWIQNDDAFVVIEYHALRDGSGAYRGTLEVTREVSDLRRLEGEQRLIEWGTTQ
ncbi:MAG: DUF438 domain-containing protein [Halodesulfurarchaeum sp.]|nr:DUF438 domain-containing protein [Halodesulfurarchaeum sp.]